MESEINDVLGEHSESSEEQKSEKKAKKAKKVQLTPEQIEENKKIKLEKELKL